MCFDRLSAHEHDSVQSQRVQTPRKFKALYSNATMFGTKARSIVKGVSKSYDSIGCVESQLDEYKSLREMRWIKKNLRNFG